jgi:Leucine-rich repeat (LRR) protein
LFNLTYLDLADTYVENISPVSNLSNLIYLDISNTKVRNVKPLFNLTNLKVLNFSEEDIDENDLHIIEENNDGIIISQY